MNNNVGGGNTERDNINEPVGRSDIKKKSLFF